MPTSTYKRTVIFTLIACMGSYRYPLTPVFSLAPPGLQEIETPAMSQRYPSSLYGFPYFSPFVSPKTRAHGYTRFDVAPRRARAPYKKLRTSDSSASSVLSALIAQFKLASFRHRPHDNLLYTSLVNYKKSARSKRVGYNYCSAILLNALRQNSLNDFIKILLNLIRIQK